VNSASTDARDEILSSLRSHRAGDSPVAPSDFGVLRRKVWPPEERYPRLRRLMEAVKTEFLEPGLRPWPEAIHAWMASQGLRTLLFGPGSPAGRRLASGWPAGSGPRLVAYDRPVEEHKRQLFEETDAGFTSTRGGIAETGGLILWPSPEEPRLLSLVPPVHVALLSIGAIRNTFWEAITSSGWAGSMPRNALLVSGPSKTADIEQTLAYGVHGPKRLLVVAVAAGST
jgi:L-lactate dehydrogenase complex protein LldG